MRFRRSGREPLVAILPRERGKDEKRKAGEAKRAQEVKERQAERRRIAASRPWRRKDPPRSQRLLPWGPDEPSQRRPSPPPRDFPLASARLHPPRP